MIEDQHNYENEPLNECVDSNLFMATANSFDTPRRQSIDAEIGRILLSDFQTPAISMTMESTKKEEDIEKEIKRMMEKDDMKVRAARSDPPSCWHRLTIWLEWDSGWLQYCWIQAIIFILGCTLLNVIYFYALRSDQKKVFEQISFLFSSLHRNLPVIFLLGSTFILALNRYFSFANAIPRTLSKVMKPFVMALKSEMEWTNTSHNRAHVIKQWRNYVLLSLLLTFRVFSKRLLLVYPTLKSIVDKGFMTRAEYFLIMDTQRRYKKEDHELYTLVLDWLDSLNKIWSKMDLYQDRNSMTKTISDAVQSLKDNCDNVIHLSKITIPRALVQLATISVYLIGFALILGNNYELEKSLKSGNEKPLFITFIYPLTFLAPYLVYFVYIKFYHVFISPTGWSEINPLDMCKLFEKLCLEADHICDENASPLSEREDQQLRQLVDILDRAAPFSIDMRNC